MRASHACGLPHWAAIDCAPACAAQSGQPANLCPCQALHAVRAPALAVCAPAVVLGSFDAAGLLGVARLQFASGAVQPVLAAVDGTILVGTARVVNGNIPAANGVLHIIDDVLDDDISLNSTAVSVMADAGDYGPFNQTQASLSSFPVVWWSGIRSRAVVRGPGSMSALEHAIMQAGVLSRRMTCSRTRSHFCPRPSPA